MENDVEHLNNLIEEIDILLGLLDVPIEDDLCKEEDTILKSLLNNKEYKEYIVYNSNTTFEKELKDLKIVGNCPYKQCLIIPFYVNQNIALCKSGALMGYKWGIWPRGVKVLRDKGLRGEDIPLEFKKSKKSKKGLTHGT